MDALRKERGVVKGRMTRLENKVKTELNSGQEISVEKIEVYIAKLEDIRKDFDDVQRKIYIAHVADPPVADVSEDEDFEDRFGNNGDSGSQASTPSNDAITQLVAQQTELLRRFADGGATARADSSVKLPVVNLPTFDGRTEEWKRFAETFPSLIHNNATIPGIQKFQYLISSISGPAAKIIESIELTNENYDVAWELLKKRFDDPRAIKKKHIQCLFAMPRVEKESSSAIRELVDFTLKHLRILKSMGLPTDTWHDLIIHMIEAKLDIMTLRAWEQSGDSTDATLDKLTDFLQNRCQIIERIEARHKTKDVVSKGDFDKPQARSRGKGKPTQSDKPVTLATSSKPRKCYFCQDDHLLYNCDKFIAMSPSARFKEVQRLKLCINCLRDDHFVNSCRMGSCKQCSERHNTLLHFTELDDGTIVKIADSSSNKPSSNVSVHHTSSSPKQQHVIMDTAIVNASQANGSSVPLRILLDSASEANFITQASCNKLGVKICRAAEIVSGLNEMQSKISQSCNVTIKSRHSNYQANVRCFVVPTITKNLPSVKINLDAVQIPPNVKLADIEFHKPNGIDMLVGAELFFDLLEAQKIELGERLPILQNTKLGWVVAGSIALDHTTSSTCNSTILTLNCLIDHCETLNKNLERFWEIENVPTETKQALSVEEQECEKFFDETTFRDDSGRFVVRLPFREDTSQLGNSREIVVRRLAQLERRFMKNKILQERYTDFMREYQELGHMSLVKESLKSNEHPVVYLPHHGVIKESSSTTKLRTVFDASSKTDSGVALNDVLHVGPTLQSSLIEIVIRFRCHNIAITGDLRKMYRQIIVHPDDRDYQRILWRESPEKPIQEFQLNTVTYGEASSAYLAIKCVRRLAEQAKHDYPIVSRVILDEMYVDDIMSGANDLQGVIAVQQQLTALLKTGGFEIHKWCSNCPESLAHVPEDRKEEISTHSIDTKGTIKTLGLEWRPHDDNFQFSVQQVEAANTKRQILSAISKFFDPLGLIGPILTSAKLLMQQTWKIDCSWDETLPTTFIEKWENFRQDLNAVKTMLIPRRVIAFDKPCRLFLQGFCDASEGAYGACLYIQAQNEHGALTSRLLCSKSRVAPIKTMSIPRLELCSALLLARMIASAQKGLRICVDGLQAWSDSTVALCWIRGDASRWKSFVANRVIEINEVVPAKHWNHVKGEENPADLISRGASPRILKNSELWWNGPSWLNKESSGSQRDKEHAPSNEIIEIIEREARNTSSTCNVISEEHQIIQEMLDRFSSLTRIERVLAYCLRFFSNLKKSSTARVQGRLSVSELQDSHRRIVKHTQASHFAEEISTLKSNGNLKSSSKIIRLNPFLDDNDVLRVGGRLQHSSLPFGRKHPIVLPAGNPFSRLLFEREHRRLMHASQLLLLSSIREKYWPIKGRDLARFVCHACVWCMKNKPRTSSQIMGALPSDRVHPSRAFTVTGVDFAGLITTLVNKGRGRKTNKSYIALFICFSTKAIHLEVTSDLTTSAFIAALRRFIGRRGRPRTIYSDNGTNFVGADRELKEVYQFVRKQVDKSIGDMLAIEQVDWKFIPPSSPHMGGLWEAGVKSCKYHLKRIMGNSLFTYEELSTALTQVEACLNSRPLSSKSSDPMDLQPLTPAHFLVGEPLTNLPDIDVTEITINRLTRWQLIQRMVQDFWKRWAADYLSVLQGRTKWKKPEENLKIDDLVVVKDDNLPPLKWKLGRVIELHSGSDGLVRVVTVRTSSGNLKRAIVKLCKLPIPSCSDKEISGANLVGGMLNAH